MTENAFEMSLQSRFGLVSQTPIELLIYLPLQLNFKSQQHKCSQMSANKPLKHLSGEASLRGFLFLLCVELSPSSFLFPVIYRNITWSMVTFTCELNQSPTEEYRSKIFIFNLLYYSPYPALFSKAHFLIV